MKKLLVIIIAFSLGVLAYKFHIYTVTQEKNELVEYYTTKIDALILKNQAEVEASYRQGVYDQKRKSTEECEREKEQLRLDLKRERDAKVKELEENHEVQLNQLSDLHQKEQELIKNSWRTKLRDTVSSLNANITILKTTLRSYPTQTRIKKFPNRSNQILDSSKSIGQKKDLISLGIYLLLMIILLTILTAAIQGLFRRKRF